MTQTPPTQNKSGQSVGAAAAAAAAGAPATTGAKPTDKPAETPAPGANGTAAAAGNGAAAGTAGTAGKKREVAKRKVFLVKGDLNTDNILEFESVNQAEKFLNSGDPAVPAVYTALQGTRIRTSKRVSLR